METQVVADGPEGGGGLGGWGQDVALGRLMQRCMEMLQTEEQFCACLLQ